MFDDYIVVIPAHNEAATISTVVKAVLRYTKNVIVVNDGSSDDTLEQLNDLPIDIINHPTNLGKSQSLYDGLKASAATNAKAVITMDGDLQHNADDIPKLISQFEKTKGLVIAGRLLELAQRPKRSVIGNNIADFFIAWATKKIIVDTQSGFRCYPTAFIAKALSKPIAHKSSFILETSLLVRAAELSYAIDTIAINAHYPENLRPSHYQPWRHTLPIVFMLTWYIIIHGLMIPSFIRAVKYHYQKYQSYKVNSL